MTEEQEDSELSERDKNWLDVYNYLHELHTPDSQEDQAVNSCRRSFFEFMIVNIIAQRMAGVDELERQEMADDLLARWRKSLIMTLNEDVKKLETILDKAPDRKHIEDILSDGEALRLGRLKIINEGSKSIRKLLGNIQKAVKEGEDDD